MTNTDPDCLFCKIVAGDIPADVVARTDTVLAFRDINPQAPTHILVISLDHHRNAVASAAANPALIGELVLLAGQVAVSEGIDVSVGGAGYRLVFNTDSHGGQEVFHTHLHLLGGRSFAWPPG